jgi:rsbT co-antagonist protein RsbR
MLAWLTSQQSSLVQTALSTLRKNAMHNGSVLPPFRFPKLAQSLVDGLLSFAESKDLSRAVAQGKQLAEQGLGLRSLLAIQSSLVPQVAAKLHEDSSQNLTEIVTQTQEYLTALLDGLVTLQEQRHVQQSDAIQAAVDRVNEEREIALRQIIRELSTPIIPIFQDIIVLPLVGKMDLERARLTTERLLESIVALRAHTVILDITGVPQLDSEAMEALLRTTRAAKLLGANCILAGIRAEAALALATSTLEIGSLGTHANLERALAFALRAKGLCVQRIANAEVPRRKS